MQVTQSLVKLAPPPPFASQLVTQTSAANLVSNASNCSSRYMQSLARQLQIHQIYISAILQRRMFLVRPAAQPPAASQVTFQPAVSRTCLKTIQEASMCLQCVIPSAATLCRHQAQVKATAPHQFVLKAVVGIVPKACRMLPLVPQHNSRPPHHAQRPPLLENQWEESLRRYPCHSPCPGTSRFFSSTRRLFTQPHASALKLLQSAPVPARVSNPPISHPRVRGRCQPGAPCTRLYLNCASIAPPSWA